MTLDRKQTTTLYQEALCAGEAALFSATSRDAYSIAKQYCTACPVIALCNAHVNPAEDGFTGTCAGKLYYDGIDVTDLPKALPPPVFRLKEVNLALISAVLDGEEDEWADSALSTVMTVCWALRRKKYTLNRISKLANLEKEYTGKLVLAFEDGASPDFRDFIASQISLPMRKRSS